MLTAASAEPLEGRPAARPAAQGVISGSPNGAAGAAACVDESRTLLFS